MIRVRLFGTLRRWRRAGVSLSLGRVVDPYEEGFKAGWQAGLFKALAMQQQTATDRLTLATQEAERVRLEQLSEGRAVLDRCKECGRPDTPPEDPRMVSLSDVRASLEVLLRRTPGVAIVAHVSRETLPVPNGLHVNGARQVP
jgi:hypothetical protein